MLSLDDVSKAYGPRTVLSGVCLVVPDDGRIGVVGPNGIGKSTLLRLMAGIEAPDTGRVLRAPPTLRVGLLDQRGQTPMDETVAQHLGRRTGVGPAEARLDELTAALATNPARVDEYSEALEAFLDLGGDDFAGRSGVALADVGLSPDRLDVAMGALSGGQAARVGLAVLLLARLDVMLLDEPTNDLDFAGLDVLEAIVEAHRGAIVTVSHDRAFLDRCVRRVVEVTEPLHEVREWAGGWTDYVAQREQARQRQYDAHGKYSSEKGRLEDRMRRQRAWSEEGVKREKRRPKDPDKINQAMRSERSEKQAAKVRTSERAIERLDVVDKPWEGWRLQLRFASRQGSDMVAVLEQAVVERGNFRLGPVDLSIRHGDRVVVTGPNGGGKSTLIAALFGWTPLASGAARMGPSVVIGEVEQERTALFGAASLLVAMVERSGLRPEEARTLLAKFALDADRVERRTEDLSPGERTRALLAILAAKECSCLVLDEPTNHLDLEAIEQVEEALEHYDGTLILVTHDRRMLERVQVSRRINVENGICREALVDVTSRHAR